MLLTRLDPAKFAALPAAQQHDLDYDPVSATAYFGAPTPPSGAIEIAVVDKAAGALKDITFLVPGVDLTEPADPEWADLVDKKYGREWQ